MPLSVRAEHWPFAACALIQSDVEAGFMFLELHTDLQVMDWVVHHWLAREGTLLPAVGAFRS